MAAAERDLYKVLGVEKGASEEEIRKQYKKLARKFHPDFNPGNKDAEKRFKEVNAAHAVLSDAEKRKRYDEFGEAGLKDGFDANKARQWEQWAKQGGFSGGGGAGGPFQGFEFHFGGGPGAGPGAGARGGGAGFGGFEDLFSAFAGAAAGGARAGTGTGRGRKRRGFTPDKGDDIEGQIEIEILDSLKGGTSTLELERGNGPERIEVKVPPGVRDGQKIRLGGLGHMGQGGAGDLIVKVGVRPGKYLSRRGDDIVLELPISIAEALRGASITLPTPLGGEATVKVPPGTSSGQTLRLRGLGVKRKEGEAGDLLVRLLVKVPKLAPAEAEELAKRLDAGMPPGGVREGFRLE